jgi:pyruvate, water dikinase
MVRNLGEKGVKVPPGFATTAEAYWQYVEANGLRRVIADSLKALDAGHASLAQIGATVRQEFLRGTLPKDLADAIQSAYRQLCSRANGETGMWLFAPAPRPKTCPTQALPDSRRAI